MANGLWMLVAASPVLCVGPTVIAAKRRRRASPAAATRSHGSWPAGEYLAPDIEAAERQLGVLLRRMRAYQRAAHAFASSRIRDDVEFERCLDLATALSLRIADLNGAAVAQPRERERIRDQIVESLSRRPTGSTEFGLWADRVHHQRCAATAGGFDGSPAAASPIASSTASLARCRASPLR
jgi:hypothetical protein